MHAKCLHCFIEQGLMYCPTTQLVYVQPQKTPRAIPMRKKESESGYFWRCCQYARRHLGKYPILGYVLMAPTTPMPRLGKVFHGADDFHAEMKRIGHPFIKLYFSEA